MKNNAKITLILLSIFCYWNMYSHGGRTNSDGGHYNRTTGEYHYHNSKHSFGDFIGGAISIFIFLALFGKSKKK